ncbi:type II toxin-antitoxin system PemK/MazF family toxin [Microcoleus sp. S1D4]|uniref:type II toxin-antitoxin system PemK/MazF family toxin n=1 Tax=unclassified Microcoleus TaxID=2642155 RepID=UPI003FA5D345
MFAGTTETKRRPGLILLDTGDEDTIVAKITSQIPRTTFDVEIQEWQQAGLKRPSVVRLHKLNTLQKSLVERRLGILALLIYGMKG